MRLVGRLLDASGCGTLGSSPDLSVPSSKSASEPWDKPVAVFVARDFRKYLQCGIFYHGKGHRIRKGLTVVLRPVFGGLYHDCGFATA